MRKFIFAVCFVLSSTALAVTGNGTGSSVQITGGGTGASTQVTGGGTGSSVQVTGNGTGREVAGAGTGAEVTSLDACFTGSFYDPENPGQGINVEVLDSQIVVYFYGADGDWFIFQGDEFGLDMYQPYNGGVDKVGSGYFIPFDDNNVEFGFDMQLDLRDVTFERPIPWCLRSDCEQAFVYTRLTQPIPCASSVEVAGTGSGTEVAGAGTGTEVAGTGSGTEVAGTGSGTEVAGTGSGKEVAGAGSGTQVTGGGTGRE